MELDDIIESRRSYRSLDGAEINDDLIEKLASKAQMAPSCFNNQPWNYVFVEEEEKLERMQDVMTKTNRWTNKASMIIAVFTKEDDDCVVKGRKYYLLDTGMATAFLILKATELGLVAHPIAGFDEEKTKDLLNIPEGYRLITLVIVGKHSDTINELLTEKQAEVEKERPKRDSLDSFVYRNEYEE